MLNKHKRLIGLTPIVIILVAIILTSATFAETGSNSTATLGSSTTAYATIGNSTGGLLTLTSGSVIFNSYITITNSSNTTYTYTPVYFAIDNNALSTNGYASPSQLDVRIADMNGNLLAMMPVSDRTFFVPLTLPAATISSFLWTSGNTLLASHPIIPGYGGNFTSVDDAATEMAGNFSLAFNGYINTASGAGKNLFYKQNAAKLYISAAGNITFETHDGADAPVIVLTLGSITSGLHTVTAAANNSTISLTVDSSSNSTAVGAGVPNTAYNMTWMAGNVSPYMNYITLAVNGAEVVRYQPVTVIQGTNLPNRTSASHNGTFNYGTNPAGITITANIFGTGLGQHEAKAPAFTLPATGNFINTTPIAGNFTAGNISTPSFPGAQIFVDIANASQTPVQLPLVIISGFFILAVSILSGWILRRFGPGSHFIKGIIVAGLMGICIGVGVYDWWMSIVFIVIALALSWMSQQRGTT